MSNYIQNHGLGKTTKKSSTRANDCSLRNAKMTAKKESLLPVNPSNLYGSFRYATERKDNLSN